MINHYNILGVDRQSSREQIKSAFRNLAKKCHPDKTPQGGAESSHMFRAILLAYETLIDDHRRSVYDRLLAQHELANRDSAEKNRARRKRMSRFERILDHLISGEKEEAIRIYEMIRRADADIDLIEKMSYNDARDCEYLLAEAYESLDNYEEAARLYERSLEHERVKPYFHRFTDEIIRRLKGVYLHQISTARAPEMMMFYIQKLIFIGGTKRDVAWAYKKLAELYVERGKVIDARFALQKAFDICPKLPGSKRICRKLGMEHLIC